MESLEETSLLSGEGLLQQLGAIQQDSMNTYSIYHSAVVWKTPGSLRPLNGWPRFPNHSAPSFPDSVLPKDETDFVLRLSEREVKQLAKPLRKGVMLDDSVFIIRDLASDVELTIRAHEVMEILEKHDRLAPSINTYASIKISDIDDDALISVDPPLVQRAPLIPAPRNKSDLINRLTEQEIQDLLAPVKSGVLAKESIFSLADAVTDIHFYVSAAELLELFDDENGYGKYETISVVPLTGDDKRIMGKTHHHKRKALIIIAALILFVIVVIGSSLPSALSANSPVQNYTTLSSSSIGVHNSTSFPRTEGSTDQTVFAAQRCFLYEVSPVSAETDDVIYVYYNCNLDKERCFPHDFDCALPSIATKDKDGKLYCRPTRNGSPQVAIGRICYCKNPIGWCIPLGERFTAAVTLPNWEKL